MLNVSKKMRILAIGAHPDDIEIGCGGTLAKFSDLGHEVFLFVATDGSAGGCADIRKTEQETSKKIMKAKGLIWGDYKDTEITIDKSTIACVEGVIRKISPDYIFINYSDDTHQDHRHLSTITVSATRYIHNVLFYETPMTQNFQPNIFVDIGQKYLDLKISLLNAHASQVDRTNISNLSILEVARSAAQFRGTQARVAYAEAFLPLRLIINIPDIYGTTL